MPIRQRRPVSKALHALNALVNSSWPEIGVRQLAAELGIAPSSAHRILTSLAEAGLVQRDDRSQRYALTAEFFRLTSRAVAMSPLRQAGLSALRRLVETCRVAALLGVYNGQRQEMSFVAASDGLGGAPSYPILMHEWLPIRTGASGLSILAFLNEECRNLLIERLSLNAPSASNNDRPASLASEIANVRRQGYAFTPCQLVSGAVGMAAPIFNHGGDVIGSVCVTLSAQSAGEDGRDRLADAVRRCASDITARMQSIEMAAP